MSQVADDGQPLEEIACYGYDGSVFIPVLVDGDGVLLVVVEGS